MVISTFCHFDGHLHPQTDGIIIRHSRQGDSPETDLAYALTFRVRRTISVIAMIRACEDRINHGTSRDEVNQK